MAAPSYVQPQAGLWGVIYNAFESKGGGVEQQQEEEESSSSTKTTTTTEFDIYTQRFGIVVFCIVALLLLTAVVLLLRIVITPIFNLVLGGLMVYPVLRVTEWWCLGGGGNGTTTGLQSLLIAGAIIKSIYEYTSPLADGVREVLGAFNDTLALGGGGGGGG